MRLLVCDFLLVYASILCLSKAGAAEIESPDGHVQAEIEVRDRRLEYRVTLDSQELLAWSPLGLASTAGDFLKDVNQVEASTPEDVAMSYDLAAGKASRVESKAREITLTIANAAEQKLLVRFRVANDSVAISYRLGADEEASVTTIGTGFAFPESTTTFLHNMAKAQTGWMRTQPSYEENYRHNRPMSDRAPQGWCLPALFKIADRGWVLVGETGVDAQFAGTHLVADTTPGVYRIALPQEEEHSPEAPVAPRMAAGQWTPWQFAILGKTLAPIVESTTVTDLVAPLYELDWQVKPGRAAWSWLKLKDDSCVEPVQRQFIDMAAQLGFEYVLIDALWDAKIGKEKIAELVDYAKTKNVSVLLWYNSNGSWNDAPQSPRDRMHTAETRAEEMAWMQKIGVKGIKVDFFGGDKQAAMQLYDGILRDGAKYGLTVNFHGTTIPRGWDRMYPNFVTCEAVKGMEFCTFDQGSADRQPEHCATLPFLRNVIGPMDFTPVIVDEGLSPGGGRPRRKTSLAFELALPVVFYSTIQHFGLVPDDLETLPDFAVEYLKSVPTTWDETRLIDGYPGRLAVLARRKGARWYVGAINGSNEPQRFILPAELATSWSVINDDAQGGLAQESVSVDASKPLELELPARGGAILISQ
jgi:hypothetical protein